MNLVRRPPDRPRSSRWVSTLARVGLASEAPSTNPPITSHFPCSPLREHEIADNGPEITTAGDELSESASRGAKRIEGF